MARRHVAYLREVAVADIEEAIDYPRRLSFLAAKSDIGHLSMFSPTMRSSALAVHQI